MKTLSGKQMCRILEERGWSLARIIGSHHIFIKSGHNLRITVPVHGNRDLKHGLQKSIMRLAGILDEEL